MPQQPGPLILQHSATLNLKPGTYDFTDLTAADMGDVDAIGADITHSLLDLADEAGAQGDPAPGFDVNAALDAIGAAPFDNLDGNTGTMAAGVADSDTFYGLASSIVPTEAWLNQPAPFDPNADPSVNLNYGTGATDGGPAAPSNLPPQTQVFNQLTTSPLYQFGLANLTQYGANQFSVGDRFKLTLDGPPYATIHVKAWFNGTNLGDVVMGQTDQVGHYELTGVMTPDQVGAWSEEWWGNAVLIQEVAFFVVSEGT